jgi:hypothetical protein
VYYEKMSMSASSSKSWGRWDLTESLEEKKAHRYQLFTVDIELWEVTALSAVNSFFVKLKKIVVALHFPGA